MTASTVLFRKSYEIFADYHQFYLMDAVLQPFAPEHYVEADIRKRIKVSDNIVVILPERNMTVPVELEVRDLAPEIDFSEWQHIAEASLGLPSGKLLIEECTGNEPIDVVELSPETYRLRACFSGLDTLSWNGLEGDDKYKIFMWTSAYEELKILKQYNAGRGSE